MGNLERSTTMSPMQCSMLLMVVGTGSGIMLVPQFTVPLAGQYAWICILLGGGLFFAISWLIIKISDLFPGETMVEYLPSIWGRLISLVILALFFVTVLIQSSVRVQALGREIGYFMFDRTPLEVIILSFLIVCVYGAVQDLGTIIRINSWMFFMSMPLIIGILMLGLINIQLINFFPQWPVKLSDVAEGITSLWPVYFGYEMLLLLLPVIGRQTTSLTAAVGSSFLFKALLLLLSFAMTVGSLTVEGVKRTVFPVLIAVRGIELPGTFIERLDNYLLLGWLPIGYITIVVLLYILAILASRLLCYRDHRPFVLLFGLILFLSSMALHDLTIHSAMREVTRWLGLGFSVAVIPATYALARWKRGTVNAAAK